MLLSVCVSVVFDLKYLILVGFGPVLVHCSVCCPAINAFKDH